MQIKPHWLDPWGFRIILILEWVGDASLLLYLLQQCWMCFELEGKLEFPSYLDLVLVPHWIGDVRLGSIYTNSSHAYFYECWAMGHISTRVDTRRTRPGLVRVACAHDLQTRIQFDLGDS